MKPIVTFSNYTHCNMRFKSAIRCLMLYYVCLSIKRFINFDNYSSPFYIFLYINSNERERECVCVCIGIDTLTSAPCRDAKEHMRS